MKHAVGKQGALGEIAGTQGMSSAVTCLFVGALDVDPTNLTYGRRPSLQFVSSVTEVILFANLLHRYLDRYDH